MIQTLDRISALLTKLAAQAAVLIMVAATLLILTEIVMRSVFATSTNIVEEFVAYALGTMVFLGLSQAMRQGALVRVDFLLSKLNPKARCMLEIFSCALALIVMSFVIYYLWVRVGRDFGRGAISTTRAATPLWIPNAIVMAGMILFMFQTFVYGLSLCFKGPLIKDDSAIE